MMTWEFRSFDTFTIFSNQITKRRKRKKKIRLITRYSKA